MILLFMEWFQEVFGIQMPMVFAYTSTRMMLAAITSLLISIFLGPFFIRKLYELKLGQPIRKEECPHLGELHAKKEDTPTMGGVLLLFALLVSLFLWMDLSHVFTLILAFVTISLGILGGVDDYFKLKHRSPKGISGKKKLAIQLIISAMITGYLFSPTIQEGLSSSGWFLPPKVKEVVRGSSEKRQMEALSVTEYASRIYVPFFKEPVFVLGGSFTLLAVLFSFLVIAGASNGVNLTDGLDGLAAGCLMMVGCSFALIAFLSNNIDISRYLNILYIEGSGEIAIYLSAFCGACLGFLWYNGHPAQVFMGDVGSLSLGAILGVSAVLLKREFLLALVGGIFVAEALSVILQVGSYKLRNKKRIFLCAPLHHHFEYKGWPETKVVIRFWIIGFLLAIIGVASLKFQ